MKYYLKKLTKLYKGEVYNISSSYMLENVLLQVDCKLLFCSPACGAHLDACLLLGGEVDKRVLYSPIMDKS